MIAIRPFIDRNGRDAFGRWFYGLDDGVQARITIALDRLEHGNTSAVKWVGAGVNELRLEFGPGYRIYFGWDGVAIIILLGGGTKKRQSVDIETAKAFWREYKKIKAEH